MFPSAVEKLPPRFFGPLPVICFIVEQFPQLCLHTADQTVGRGSADCVRVCVKEGARNAGADYVWAAVLASLRILSILA